MDSHDRHHRHTRVGQNPGGLIGLERHRPQDRGEGVAAIDRVVHGPLVSNKQLNESGILPAPATFRGPAQDTERGDQLDLGISP
jgi:hypothetical protein